MVVTSSGVIASEPRTGIWFTEFSEPYDVLIEAGCTVDVVSPRGAAAPIDPRSYPQRDAIAEVRDALAALNATRPIANVDAADYDALFLPGGHGPMFDLVDEPHVKTLVRATYEAGKVVGSVCHGPAGLLNVTMSDGTNFLAGKRLTAYSPAEDATDALFRYLPFALSTELQRQGASYSDRGPKAEYVVVDGRLVTGQNPQSGAATARAFLDAVAAVRA